MKLTLRQMPAGIALVLSTLVTGAAHATVLDSFTATTSGNTESVTTSGNWGNLTYTGGAGIEDGVNRLVVGRSGWTAYSTTLTIDPTAGTFSGSGGSASTGGFIAYGTGIGWWFDSVWAGQQYGTAPALTGGQRLTQLNLHASLTDSLYVDAATSGSMTLYLTDANGQLIDQRGLEYSAGHNAVTFGSFKSLTAGSVQNIHGIAYTFGGSATTLNEVGFSVSAVPEPETYAMMLAGLGVVGAVARRRQRRAR